MIDDILRNTDYYKDQIKYYKRIEKKGAVFCPLPEDLDSSLVKAFKEKGIKEIYSHQREAYDAITGGENVIITTPTASGKTLCFNLPVLNSLITDPKSTYIYIYPTKALTEDQRKRLLSYNIKPHKIYSYDGDTPSEERAYIRRNAGLIFTNPDMLHISILSHHKQWENYFYNLKYVVFDEFHHYKGTFASHISAIIRRLRRICAYYGSNPQFIFSSATLSNPKEFAHDMTGLDFQVIDKSGAPSGEKNIIFWNPQPVGYTDDNNEFIETFRNTSKEAYNLTITLTELGKKVIVFPRSRKRVELLVKSLRETLPHKNIFSYRSGYTREERRRIEKQLFNGEIDVVVATNALELGIDVGALDAVVTVGYPGSVSSLWQQFGRSGRGDKDGVGIFIARDDLIDQYYMERPEEFFDKALDRSVVNNENEFVLFNQIACALCEMPMTPEEVQFYFGNKGLGVVGELLDAGLVKYNNHFYWYSKESPHINTNIRGTDMDEFEIKQGNKVLGVCDYAHVYSTLHEGAIYLHDGEPYKVVELDEESKKAYVTKTEADFYTNVHEDIEIDNINREQTYKTKRLEFNFAMCNVKTKMPFYTMKQFNTGKVIGKMPLSLPDTNLYTQSVYFTIDDKYVQILSEEGIMLDGAIHALEHILIGVAPILINCDRNDLGGVSYPLFLYTDKPTVFIYDGYEGGIGVSKELFNLRRDWFNIAFDTVSKCPCKMGCPACIQSPKCGNNNQPLNKEGAQILLDCLLTEIDY